MELRIDLTGQRFGRLVVSEFDGVRGNGETYWKCICDCGCAKVVSRGNLRSGTTQSCGCLRKETSSKTHHKNVKYDLTGDFGVGYTVNDGTPFFFDKDEHEKIKPYSWFRNDQGYIIAIGKDGHQVRMHRLITGYSGLVDHRNGKRFDNRKQNLREADHQLNGINRKCNKNNKLNTKGVFKIRDRFYARIMKDGKTISLGGYATLEEARTARLNAEKDLFGEFAYREMG
ncbi:MAG: hypothetical protein NC548_48470 [Lachnospiraceae bacterium]|nr:hypothetical protein [Lachnospiraceae bacterium]